MSVAKCDPGWGEGLSTQTLHKARDFHPTPPLRVDPPPPGEGKSRARLQCKHTFAYSRRNPPEFCYELPALPTEGAGNAGRLVRPPPRVQWVEVESTRVSQVTPETPGIPHAMVLRLTSCSPRRSGSFATVTSRISACRARRVDIASPRNLTPASRRQDHTTSPSASGTLVRSTLRVHRIPSRVRDDRDTPLEWDGTA